MNEEIIEEYIAAYNKVLRNNYNKINELSESSLLYGLSGSIIYGPLGKSMSKSNDFIIVEKENKTYKHINIFKPIINEIKMYYNWIMSIFRNDFYKEYNKNEK